MNKRILLLPFLALLATTALYAGAGADKTEPDPDMKVIEWIVVSWNFDESEPVLEAFNEKLQAVLPGYALNVRPIAEEAYDDKTKLIISSGEAYDIMWSSFWAGNYKEKLLGGAFAPIDEYLDGPVMGLKKAIPDFAWAAGMLNGKIYGVPTYQEMYSMRDLVIRNDIAAAGGVDMAMLDAMGQDPNTKGLDYLKALQPALEASLDLHPAKVPMLILTDELVKEWDYEEIVNGVVISKTAPGPIKALSWYESDIFKESLALFREWYTKGIYPADAATIEDIDGNETHGAFIDWGGYPLEMRDDALAMYRDDKNLTEHSVLSAIPPYLGYSAGTATMNFISASSEDPEAALKILEVINTDADMYNLLAYGIEGEYYSRTGDGINFLKKKDNGEPVYDLGDWVIGNVLLSHSQSEANKSIKIKKMNEMATLSPLRGFNLDLSSVTNEVSQIQAITDQYRNALLWGTVSDWEEVYSEFLAKLNAAGIATVVESIQEQITAFENL